MKYPLVANYAGDLVLLETPDAAREYIERDDVRSNRVQVFDADGRLLNIRLVETAHPGRLLGIFKLSGRGEEVVIEKTDDSEHRPESLRNLLLTYLSHPAVSARLRNPERDLNDVELPTLVDELRAVQSHK